MPEDEEVMLRISNELVEAVAESLPLWIERSVQARIGDVDFSSPDVQTQLQQSIELAQIDVVGQLRTLLALDIDQQTVGPLQILRKATMYPTQILQAAGVAPVSRDEQATAMFPDDLYDLTPANFADLGPDVHEKAIVWGAAKAHIHLSRRRAEGQL